MAVRAMTKANEPARARPSRPTSANAGRALEGHAKQGRSDLSDLSDQTPGVRRVDLCTALAVMRAAFRPDDTREELLYAFHERAGILEFDCGLQRDDAERQALAEMMKRNESAGAEIVAARSDHWPRDFDARQETLAFQDLIKLER
jgi:hypothetical protein